MISAYDGDFKAQELIKVVDENNLWGDVCSYRGEHLKEGII